MTPPTFLAEGQSSALATSFDSASLTATADRPLIVWIASAASSLDCSGVVLDPTGTPQAFTRLDRGTAASGSSCSGELWVLDSPSPVTAVVRASHANVSTTRTIQVAEQPDADRSTSTAWRDAIATTVITNSGTTHEIAITSAVGDLPVAFVSLRQSASAPNLTNNGDTTTVDNILGGTTIRGRILSGTGAASVTLGGTTASATQSVVMGFNVNAAAAGGVVAALNNAFAGGLQHLTGGLQQ